MAKKIMVQGTMSNSGKSFLAAALCRIFTQDGYRTAPFKSQNMALNSYITRDGLEIGRAQAMQAEAAGIAPTVDMNPILLKPTSQMGSQVIVMGEVCGDMRAMEYYRRKPEFIPVIREAFSRLEQEYDVIVLEGAGSPAEINLREHDIVNMGMAKLAEAPVILVGDIDRGGVFASLYGTVALLEEEERRRIRGLVINKFRGDVKILEPGLRMIEEKLGIPVIGVIPMEDIDLDDEDSLAERLTGNAPGERVVGAGAGESGQPAEPGVVAESGRPAEPGAVAESGQPAKPGVVAETGQPAESQAGVAQHQALDLAVIHLPHISNFTDFNIFGQLFGQTVRYVEKVASLGRPDLVILPGTKNTMADLRWLRQSGLEAAILRLSAERVPVMGICGGYQMLGSEISDPDCVEGGGSLRGMGLLPARTVFAKQKTRTQVHGRLMKDGFPAFETVPHPVSDDDFPLAGYEIHMGITVALDSSLLPLVLLEDGRTDGLIRADGLVWGSYLHGLFDNEALTERLLQRLARKKGVSLQTAGESRDSYRQRQYDRLAELVRRSLDMKQLYEIMELEWKKGEDQYGTAVDPAGGD